MIPTPKDVIHEIRSSTDDSGDEYLCVFYTGIEDTAVDSDGKETHSLGFDIVGPNVDQLSVANLLDRYKTPQYTIKAVVGRPDANFYINDGLDSLEKDLKERV